MLLESPKAPAEERCGPSSTIQSTRQFWEAAEDSSVLGRSRIPPEKRGKTGIGPNLKENLRISGKLLSLLFNALPLTEPYSSALSTIPNNSGMGLMGQMSVL